MNTQRRNVLKGMAAMPLLSQVTAVNLFADSTKKELVKSGKVLTAAHWGVMDVSVQDGKIIDSKPHLNISEFKDKMLEQTADMVYKSRIKYPMVRKSYLENPDSPKPELRGRDEWVRVRYEDAIKLVVRELKKTRAQKGLKGVFGGAEGWRSTGNIHNSTAWLHRFLNFSGGFVKTLEDYSTAAGQIILPHILGSIEVYEQQTSWNVVFENTKVIVIWGSDPVATLRVGFTSDDDYGTKCFEELKKRTDIKLVIIDPIKSHTGQFFDGRADWVTPIPNTDTTMMLAMSHHLYTTGKYDKEFMDKYTVGFDKFLPYLLGQSDGTPKTPEWAEKICGVKADKIRELADLMQANRTTIMCGWAMQRADHGEQPYWAIVTLASMLGQIGLPGGGVGFSYHYSSGGNPTCKAPVIGGMNRGSVGAFNKDGEFIGTTTEHIDANGKFVKGKGVEGFVEPQGFGIPASRIADALLNRGKKFNHNGKELTYPDIDFIYWAGGNPFVHHQDLNRFKKAWQSVRTVVINEQYWTPTAKMADIVFPATTPYERNDITMCGDYSNQFIIPMKQVVEKQDEARDDYQIFSDLAKAYAPNLVMAFTENGKDEFDWIKQFYEAARDQVKGSPEVAALLKPFDEFWAENQKIEFYPTPESMSWVRHAEFREDPILNALGTPSGLIEIYSEEIAGMGYEGCKAHAMWFEPAEWLGMNAKPAQFALLSPHPSQRLHSQLGHTSLRNSYAVANREPIWINDKDAKEKGIKNGDIVRVFNARGEIIAGAVVTPNISRNVVRICEGVWYDPDENGMCKNGCANVLTIDKSTSELANGPIADTTLVNIEKFRGEAPELTAFSDPKFA